MFKKIFLFAILLCTTATMGAQELCLEGNEINIPDHISLKEVQSISHSVDAAGATQVQISKYNGTEYIFSPAALPEMSVKSYAEAVLDNPLYAGMKYVNGRDIHNIQSLEDGDLLGLFNEMDMTLDEYIVEAYRYAPNVDSIMQILMNLNAVKLVARTGIKRSKIRVHKQSFAYVSSDLDGTKLMLTANVVYPYSAGLRTLACEDMFLDNHLTAINSDKCPSLMMCNNTLVHGAATRGLCVIQPDLYGIGASRTRTQQYVDRKVNPKHIVDCMLAVRQYEEHSKNTSAPLTIDGYAQLIITGASQGATSALATTYYLENQMDPAQRRRLPNIKETRLCGGAFDMKLTLNEYCRENRVVFSAMVPLLMQGVFAARHNEILDEEGKPYSVHEFMNPLLRTRKWDTTDQGLPGEHTIWEMLDAKNIESVPIIRAMTEVCGVVDPSIKMLSTYSETNRILSPDLLVQIGENSYKLNEESHKVQAFAKVLDDNDLTSTELWVPKSDIRLVHGRDDYMVPFANSQQLYDRMHDKMLGQGNIIELKAVDDIDHIGNHIVFCAVWAFSQVGDMDIDTLMGMMPDK